MAAELRDTQPKSWTYADAVMESRCAEGTSSSTAAREPGLSAEASERDSSIKDAKESEGSDSETKAPKEVLLLPANYERRMLHVHLRKINKLTSLASQPPSPQPRSPLKRRPTSTRPSGETFRSLLVDDDDSRSKQSSFSVGDNSSIYTLDSNDERRLSDKVKKAWRGVTGQKYVDPLEQWMAKHSGGTLRDVRASRACRNSAERR
jgi:hypothetical protein